MFKIAITGKANSGKDTLSRMITKEFRLALDRYVYTKCMAFADPLKEMIRIMFPTIPKKNLYGSSNLRNEIIPGAFKDGNPLTIRQLLIDLGTEVGRKYKESVWLDNFDARLAKVHSSALVIVTDARFRNEFDHLKHLGFVMIKLSRDGANPAINHISETSQDSIQENEFDFVINNNGTLSDLKHTVREIVTKLASK